MRLNRIEVISNLPGTWTRDYLSGRIPDIWLNYWQDIRAQISGRIPDIWLNYCQDIRAQISGGPVIRIDQILNFLFSRKLNMKMFGYPVYPYIYEREGEVYHSCFMVQKV